MRSRMSCATRSPALTVFLGVFFRGFFRVFLIVRGVEKLECKLQEKALRALLYTP